MNRMFVLACCLVVIVVACKEETDQIAIDFGYAYFPLETGKYWIYQLDSIVYDPIAGGTAADSSTLFLKEEIIGTFTDNSGDTWYKLERFTRRTPAEPWVVKDVVAMRRSERQALRLESNLEFVKMVFPLKKGTSWDGNQFFETTLAVSVADEPIRMFEFWEHRLVDLGTSYQLNNLSFSEVATISLADFDSRTTTLRKVEERYAKSVGLIERTLFILDTQCEVCCNRNTVACADLLWHIKAEAGFSLRQQLIDYK